MFIPITSLNNPPAVFAVRARPLKLSPLVKAFNPCAVLFKGFIKFTVPVEATLNNLLASLNFSKFFKLVSILPPYLLIFQRDFGTDNKPLIAPAAPPTAPPTTDPSGPTIAPSMAPIAAYSIAASVIIPPV